MVVEISIVSVANSSFYQRRIAEEALLSTEVSFAAL